jgi:hypothetical protein
MKALIKTAIGFTCAAVLAASCTVKKQETPPLTGPSEFGTSVSVSVTPDVLTTDGGSQALVTVTVRDANGQPVRNQSLRADIYVDGAIADFGALSARNLVTDTNGRATLVYTAPAVNGSVDTGTVVSIGITPIGGDFANTVIRSAAVRLVPQGTVLGPDGMVPRFSWTPLAPTTFQPVLFDASASTASPTNPIVTYRWEFSDGDVRFGRQVSKSFETTGRHAVRLTVFDAAGRSQSLTQEISVGLLAGPEALFDVSPDDPTVGEIVRFNAARSTASPGATIVSYVWDLGNGQTATGQMVQTTYSAPRTYIVLLTVTDSFGRKHTSQQSVTVE